MGLEFLWYSQIDTQSRAESLVCVMRAQNSNISSCYLKGGRLLTRPPPTRAGFKTSLRLWKTSQSLVVEGDHYSVKSAGTHTSLRRP
ncbi:hypothetical protein CBS11852_9311 [Aspergillus niger]|nr:hypothetical protein CBS11350_5202 [Aspergillus niger]KAI2883206.1 hypothetical protein CBS11852_9311 [Aspergillus niger]